ncbi:hypothetical protein [Catellatospora methionotrophica]|uniref:hypothetical protein n=1 Tax=Catellatospora methionotrophica TaxID=121620 RepID=UPI0033D4D4E9
MSHPPLNIAVWKAHEAFKGREGEALSPEMVEEIAIAAIAAYLKALSRENKVRTGYQPGHDGGDTWIHRPLYSPDFDRLATQAEATIVGPLPDGELIW